jgi:hypothetical protein
VVDGCPPTLGRHRVAQLVVVEQRAKSIGKPLRGAGTARPQLMASSSTMPNEALSQGVQKTSPVTR